MAFYTGSANSFLDLRAALFSACVTAGWTQEDSDTLSKGDAVVRVTESVTNSVSVGVGLIFQGATGLSDGSLVNPSITTPRFGPPNQTVNQAAWPMTYFIHIFDDPDEVFLVANFNVDTYWWAAFGVSDIPGLSGTGLWLSATSRGGQGHSAGAGSVGIQPNGGGSNLASQSSSGAIFWQTGQSAGGSSNNDTIHSNFDAVQWAGNPDSNSDARPQAFNAIWTASTLISLMPSAWNSEAILLPIQGYVWRPSNKCSLAVDVRHARYTRVDNYTPGQIISLGDDDWKIYPFYKKNSAARDGGNNVDHSGTFGWAIRYDGP